jgi:hypothetical protein
MDMPQPAKKPVRGSEEPKPQKRVEAEPIGPVAARLRDVLPRGMVQESQDSVHRSDPEDPKVIASPPGHRNGNGNGNGDGNGRFRT